MQHLDVSSVNLEVGQGAGLGDGGVVALQPLHCPLHQPRSPAPAGQPHVHRVLPLQCGYQRVMQWSLNPGAAFPGEDAAEGLCCGSAFYYRHTSILPAASCAVSQYQTQRIGRRSSSDVRFAATAGHLDVRHAQVGLAQQLLRVQLTAGEAERPLRLAVVHAQLQCCVGCQLPESHRRRVREARLQLDKIVASLLRGISTA